MAVNPMALLQLKECFDTFHVEHPKFIAYLNALRTHALSVGSVMEMKVTTPDGEEYVANIRLTENDVTALKLIARNEQ